MALINSSTFSKLGNNQNQNIWPKHIEGGQRDIGDSRKVYEIEKCKTLIMRISLSANILGLFLE